MQAVERELASLFADVFFLNRYLDLPLDDAAANTYLSFDFFYPPSTFRLISYLHRGFFYF